MFLFSFSSTYPGAFSLQCFHNWQTVLPFQLHLGETQSCCVFFFSCSVAWFRSVIPLETNPLLVVADGLAYATKHTFFGICTVYPKVSLLPFLPMTKPGFICTSSFLKQTILLMKTVASYFLPFLVLAHPLIQAGLPHLLTLYHQFVSVLSASFHFTNFLIVLEKSHFFSFCQLLLNSQFDHVTSALAKVYVFNSFCGTCIWADIIQSPPELKGGAIIIMVTVPKLVVQ